MFQASKRIATRLGHLEDLERHRRVHLPRQSGRQAVRRVVEFARIVSLEIRFAPSCKGQRADAFGHVLYIGNVPYAGQIGLAVGRRGIGPEAGATAGGASEDCAKSGADANKNAANAAAKIKQEWKWFFTWKPFQTGYSGCLDGPESLRVLLYHCETHARPSLDFMRRRHPLCSGSLRASERITALRAALQPQPGHFIHGPFGGSLHRLLSLRVRRLDQEESDPAGSGPLGRLFQAQRGQRAFSVGDSGGGFQAQRDPEPGGDGDRRLLRRLHGSARSGEGGNRTAEAGIGCHRGSAFSARSACVPGTPASGHRGGWHAVRLWLESGFRGFQPRDRVCGRGRPGSSGPRLLHQDRREVARDAAEVCGTRAAHVRTVG